METLMEFALDISLFCVWFLVGFLGSWMIASAFKRW